MKKSNWKVGASFLSSVVVFLLVAFTIMICIQNDFVGSTIQVFAHGGRGAVISGQVYGYDETLSSVENSSFSTTIKNKNNDNWQIGDMVFAPTSNGEAAPIYLEFTLENTSGKSIFFSIVNESDTHENVLFEYSIEGKDFAETFNNRDAIISPMAEKTFVIRMSVIDASVSFSQSPIDFSIIVEDYVLNK